ncbi:protein kinase family protein [Saccharibacillus alkalitolerans]|uniref:Uncharacterized protein n=1 Tax=Saccharibacillus alkalitolerans TaxID=2705290 RepID=A0ABX0F2B9_9BACL|nr:hypothetical protein [Saccharibacillus alkalitolerans]NGZ74702.1 hypothetical protein [Saccharibacillus alkalitolerans]
MSEVVMELCYFTFMMRRIGLLAVSEDEAEEHLQKTTSSEVARFIKDGIKILKESYVFSPTLKMFFEARMLECIRNPNISAEELKAIHYSVYLFEYCQQGDLKEVIRYSEVILDFEYSEEEPFCCSSEDAVKRVRGTLVFLKNRDYDNIAVDRKEFEHYKSEGWEYDTRNWNILSKEDIDKLLDGNRQS